MTQDSERLTFATQGGEYSYHAIAARAIAGQEVIIDEKKKFGEVIRASRSSHPGLGVIAITTVVGTVEASAKQIVRQRPSALPPVVARVDLPVELALIGSTEQSLEELNRHGVHCLGQKPAIMQCGDFLDEHLPWLRLEPRRESTRAVKEAIAKNDRDYVAIGPYSAAEPLGGVVLGPKQINPQDSVSTFYILQRDPRMQILPEDPEKTAHHTVITLAHPEGEGELDKCLYLAKEVGVEISRFIPYDIGDFTKHDKELRRGGGLFEFAHDIYDEVVTEWCARVPAIESNDGVRGPFSAKRLGGFRWYPGDVVNLSTLTSTTI